ncbi:hypothetical protein [Pleionea sediminis]|uniref:hypothetical protein n=1 Tax=Pleionea sediminis TaxID=2569479 RepID=UPI00118503D9|nr:hypothetical protein [Pleionea sediminis]
MHNISTGLAVQAPFSYTAIEAAKPKLSFFQSIMIDFGTSVLTWGEAFQMMAAFTGFVAIVFRIVDFFKERKQKETKL